MRPIAVLFLAAGLAWAEDSGFVTRTHDVRALRATGSSKPGPRLSLKTIPDTSAVENGEEYEEVAAFDSETLTWAMVADNLARVLFTLACSAPKSP